MKLRINDYTIPNLCTLNFIFVIVVIIIIITTITITITITTTITIIIIIIVIRKTTDYVRVLSELKLVTLVKEKTTHLIKGICKETLRGWDFIVI
jgi:hypothetical protein